MKQTKQAIVNHPHAVPEAGTLARSDKGIQPMVLSAPSTASPPSESSSRRKQAGQTQQHGLAQRQSSRAQFVKHKHQQKLAKAITTLRRAKKEEDALRIRKGIEIYLRKSDIVLVVLAVVAVALAITSLEMEWDPQSDALLALRSLETIVSLATVGVLFYHYLLVDSFNFATQWDRKWGQRITAVVQDPGFWLQALVCLIHTPPGVAVETETVADWPTVLVVTLRPYLLLRLFHFKSCLIDIRDSLLLQGKSLSAFGTFKHLFHADPWAACIPFVAVGIMLTSYGFYKFEGKVSADFTFKNSMWHSLIVITTVGFGDIYTASDLGKMHTVFTAILGMIMAFFFLTAVLETLSSDLQAAEHSKSIAKKKKFKMLQIAACEVISTAYIYSRAKRLFSEGLLSAEKLAAVENAVKEEVQKFAAQRQANLGALARKRSGGGSKPNVEEQVESMSGMLMTVKDECVEAVKQISKLSDQLDKSTKLIMERLEARHDEDISVLRQDNNRIFEAMKKLSARNEQLAADENKASRSNHSEGQRQREELLILQQKNIELMRENQALLRALGSKPPPPPPAPVRPPPTPPPPKEEENWEGGLIQWKDGKFVTRPPQTQ